MAITIKDCSVSNCGTAVRARGHHDIKIDGLSVRDTKTVFDVDGHVKLDARNVSATDIEYFLKAHKGLPADLTDALIKDVQHGSSGEEIVEKYGDRLKGYGLKLDSILTWSERTARGVELLSILARWFGG